MRHDKNEQQIMVSFALNKSTDANLIHWLNVQGNCQTYLKAVIRADLERFEEENYCELMNMTNKTMKEAAASKPVILSVPTRATAKSKIMADIRKSTEIFDNLSEYELSLKLFDKKVCEYCKDGIVFYKK